MDPNLEHRTNLAFLFFLTLRPFCVIFIALWLLLLSSFLLILDVSYVDIEVLSSNNIAQVTCIWFLTCSPLCCRNLQHDILHT